MPMNSNFISADTTDEPFILYTQVEQGILFVLKSLD